MKTFKEFFEEATSSPGRVKRAGASCKGSATELRKRAKKYGGEKGKMYHWCANMKGGKKKSPSSSPVTTPLSSSTTANNKKKRKKMRKKKDFNFL